MGRSPKRRCIAVGQAFDITATLDQRPHEYPIGPCARTTRIMLDHCPSPIQTTSFRGDHRIAGVTPFPLFDLPQEIRDLIYYHLVVDRTSESEPVIKATRILKAQQKRIAAKASRERLNRQRSERGGRLVRRRSRVAEPSLHLNLLLASRRLYAEASDCLYGRNWFQITLNKLPATAFDAPRGWDFSRVKKLEVELQVKDAIRMNRYVDWRTFLSAFPSLQSLRIVPVFHPRYYEWAYPELRDWDTAHYVHKAFFRELLTAIPHHISLKIGARPIDMLNEESTTTRRINNGLLYDMYAELGSRTDLTFLRPVSLLRSAALRPAALSAAPRARVQVRFATSDYGSGDGNPAGEKPAKQGQNPSENLEHPGPAPPKVAQGKSSSSPNSDNGGSNSNPRSDSSTSNAKTGSSSTKREFSTSARQNASKEPAVEQGKQNQPSSSEVKGAQPKILNENPPKSSEQSEEVSNADAKNDKIPGGASKNGNDGNANEVIDEATKEM
ncbi:hypothetical protein T440DRAFT_420855 [Plenodomus tracheiphilus IPT5]|uniref:DUF7730 domain-containing protein n=1 Tax=Plenodomus tracheiphilus IPT5 TaxID=1408161 RepID=A0A6A7B9C8_9PLEO|nr:hypothetical protein T440DRAFT_420855 [Plenodomus tracheiphilus IPT5]